MKNDRNIQKMKKRKRNAGIKKRLKGILVMCFMVAVLFNTASAAERNHMVRIVVRADDQTITQGQTVPELSFQVNSENPDKIEGDWYLDAAGEYTASQLIEELKNGLGITVICQTDGKKTGTFPIELELSEELLNYMNTKWASKVEIELKEGILTVEEKVVSEKFKKLDSSQPMIALTFDDGPGERTLELLNMLEKYDAHATFFMLGQNFRSIRMP